jgi:hypothetical protein
MSEHKVEDFIYTYDNVIDPFICKKIIKLFDNERLKTKGRILSGVDTEIKNTTDFTLFHSLISKSVFYKDWSAIFKLLTKQINKYINKYIESVNESDNVLFKESVSNFLQFDSFMIQKYNKNEGKYEYHNDSHYEMDRNRIITYIFYLNDVEIGGETEFNRGKFIVKPKCGKLALFPATWTYPHCGKMPISDDKYIITGWAYTTTNHCVLDIVKKFQNIQKH